MSQGRSVYAKPEDKNFVERVMECFVGRPIAMAELADGVVVAEFPGGCNLYFDTLRWHADVVFDNAGTSPFIGMIYGSRLRPEKFEQFYGIARGSLSRRNNWYVEPREFEVPEKRAK